MKKILSFVLVLVVLLCISPLTCNALAPKGDKVFSQNATWSESFGAWQNVTVKSGVTVTVKNTTSTEVHGTLKVEPGAKLVGSEPPKGYGFNIIIKPGAKVEGITLCYQWEVAPGDIRILPVPVDYSELFKMDWFGEGYAIKWSNAVSGWVITDVLKGNPFNQKIYHLSEDMSRLTACADMLNSLNLLQGTGTKSDGTPEYSLMKKATRFEAVVMLIRLLGRESDALGGYEQGLYSHPFKDVPDWADAYIAYAYSQKLANGVSADEFGGGEITAQQYITLALRSLGYSDAEGGDFEYAQAIEFAESIGLIELSGRRNIIDTVDFIRADMIGVSYNALEQSTKDGGRLWEKLSAEGVFTSDAYQAACAKYSSQIN